MVRYVDLIQDAPIKRKELQEKETEPLKTRKLGKEDIPKIRQRLTEGATLAQVGREFGVSYVMIRYIRDGKQWAEY